MVIAVGYFDQEYNAVLSAKYPKPLLDTAPVTGILLPPFRLYAPVQGPGTTWRITVVLLEFDELELPQPTAKIVMHIIKLARKIESTYGNHTPVNYKHTLVVLICVYSKRY